MEKKDGRGMNMGDRAVITTKKNMENNGIGIYVHWHGARGYIEPFLEYCRQKGYRSTTEDESYAFSRLTQVIANYVGNETGVGIGCVNDLDVDNGDNGTYIINDWKITDRLFVPYEEYKYRPTEDHIIKILRYIDERQPVNEQMYIDMSDDMIRERYREGLE